MGATSDIQNSGKFCSLKVYIHETYRQSTVVRTTGDNNLNETVNNNGVRSVNSASPKNLILESTIFPLHDKHIQLCKFNIHYGM
jgi:hypothetical protein